MNWRYPPSLVMAYCPSADAIMFTGRLPTSWLAIASGLTERPVESRGLASIDPMPPSDVDFPAPHPDIANSATQTHPDEKR
jgi:hypothetical protein